MEISQNLRQRRIYRAGLYLIDQIASPPPVPRGAKPELMGFIRFMRPTNRTGNIALGSSRGDGRKGYQPLRLNCFRPLAVRIMNLV
jgi:hypothetical protein